MRKTTIHLLWAIAGIALATQAYAGEANTMPRNQKFISLQAARNMVHARHQMPVTPPRFIAVRQSARMMPLRRAGALQQAPARSIAASPPLQGAVRSGGSQAAQDARSQQLLSLFPGAD